MAIQTAKQIIDGALLDLQVKTAGIDLTDSEYSDSLVVLNSMMLSMDRSGIRLNWTILENKGETITSPDWAEAMIRARLAVKVATMFGATISESLRLSVIEETNIVTNSIVSIIQPSLPSTMPTGAGHGNCNRYSRNYFGNMEANDLLFGNGGKMADDEGTQLKFEDLNNES